MIVATRATSLEEAEEIGSRLIAEGISPQIQETAVLVSAEDAERAWQILGIEEPPAELVELTKPAPFHPCPSCNAADPVWLGKRKMLLLICLTVVALISLRTPAFPFVAIGAVVAFAIAIMVIPEWECRQCHHRWSKEPVD